MSGAQLPIIPGTCTPGASAATADGPSAAGAAPCTNHAGDCEPYLARQVYIFVLRAVSGTPPLPCLRGRGRLPSFSLAG